MEMMLLTSTMFIIDPWAMPFLSKKLTGNTKIIVPDDVAVILDITVGTGIVKVFDESPQINAGNIHYFSDNVNEARKRMKITIRVQTGNVEIVRG